MKLDKRRPYLFVIAEDLIYDAALRPLVRGAAMVNLMIGGVAFTWGATVDIKFEAVTFWCPNQPTDRIEGRVIAAVGDWASEAVIAAPTFHKTTDRWIQNLEDRLVRAPPLMVLSGSEVEAMVVKDIIKRRGLKSTSVVTISQARPE